MEPASSLAVMPEPVCVTGTVASIVAVAHASLHATRQTRAATQAVEFATDDQNACCNKERLNETIDAFNLLVETSTEVAVNSAILQNERKLPGQLENTRSTGTPGKELCGPNLTNPVGVENSVDEDRSKSRLWKRDLVKCRNRASTQLKHVSEFVPVPRSTCTRSRLHKGTGSPSRFGQAVLREMHELLTRLSPDVRRRFISSALSEVVRQQLESWIVCQRREERATVATENEHLKTIGHKQFWSKRLLPSGNPQFPRMRGVATLSQQLKTGGRSTWYYAIMCLSGVEIVCRMCRERSAAELESSLLQKAKDSVHALIRAGQDFESAVREVFAQFGLVTLENDRDARMKKPVLRFYPTVDVGWSYVTTLRGPFYRDLDEVLRARRRLMDARGDANTRFLSHRDALQVSKRCREVVVSLFSEQGAVDDGLERVVASHEKVERCLIGVRNRSAIQRLRRLLPRPSKAISGAKGFLLEASHSKCENRKRAMRRLYWSTLPSNRQSLNLRQRKI